MSHMIARLTRYPSGRALTLAMAMALASTWLIGRWSYPLDQNREAETPPSLTAGLPLDMDAHRRLEAAIRDALPVSRVTIPLIGGFAFDHGYSLRSDVWQGRGGELFLGAEFTNPCRGGGSENRRAFERLLSLPETQGDDPRIRVVIPVNKSMALASQLQGAPSLGTIAALTECETNDWIEVEKLLAGHPRAATSVDGAIAAAAHWGLLPYYEGDTHWTPAGAAAFSLRLGEWIAPRHPFNRSEQLGRMFVTKSVLAGGDLYRLAGVPRNEEAPIVELRLSEPPPMITQEVGRDSDGKRMSVVQATNPGAPLRGSTLIIADSFINSAVSTLFPLFERATVVRTAHRPLSFLRDHRGAFDHVIIESVARHAPREISDIVSDSLQELRGALKPTGGASWDRPTWPG